MELMIIACLAVLGLCLGSFVNALVWRLHEQAKGGKKAAGLSIVNGRSMCPHCRHELAAKDLIPVFSWLQLRGRCRYCHKKFDDTPLAELGLAVLFIVSYLYWPAGAGELFTTDWQATINFSVWLVVLTGFMALLIYDLKWMLLPNRIIYPLLAIAAALAIFNLAVDRSGTSFYGLIFGVVVAGGLFFLLFQVSDGKWIGGGDVKLGALAGLLLADPYLAFLMLLTASTSGTVLVLPLLATKRLKPTSRIPFGPFLILATIVAYLFGGTLIDWYKRSLGL